MNVGRLVLPALRWRPETGFHHEERAIEAALELGVGGFIIFGVPGARADEIGTLIEDVLRRAGRPLLIGADLERGAGQQARRLTPIPPPGALASLKDDAVIAWAGATTGREARRLGINWVFAPVADLDIEPRNPIVQTRSFGSDPSRVGRAVTTWIRACQAEGVLACAKHYPGHGRTTLDSHDTLPVVPLSLEELNETDLHPFRKAVESGVRAVMTSHVAFPAWDPSGLPATRSKVMLDHLRGPLGFGGLIVTDALIMQGAQSSEGEGDAMVASLRAGCDLLLYPPSPAATVDAIRLASAVDPAAAARCAQALERYEHALAIVAAPVNPAWQQELGNLSAPGIADRLLARGMVRGAPPALDGGVSLAVVDDDQGGWYAPGPSDLVARFLADGKHFERHEGRRIVLAFAEPRAAKGRAGFGPESLARLEALVPDAALVVLFAHPRLAAEIPGECPVLLAWHRQPLMQEAVARWITARL
jgi:beta-glucosidase-like glycosyl hydrolase